MAAKNLKIVLELVDKASAQLTKVGKSFDGLSSKMKAATGASKALAGGMLVMSAAIGAGAVKSINLAREQIRVEKQLDAVIRSTGGAAGLTADEIKKMAQGLQKVSNFGDEAIISGQNMLLTFTNIGKDVFPEATQTMLDMSAAMGTDLKTNAILVGKALNDPIAGISALSRVGVQLTDDQKDLIKSLQEVGDTAGAQTVILEELATQFGGSAEAQIDPLIQLQNAVGDIGEEIGKLLIEKINPIVEGLLAWMDQMGGLQGVIEKSKTWLEEHKMIIFIVAGAIMGALVPALVAGAIAAWAFLSPLIPFIVIGAVVAAIVYGMVKAWQALTEKFPMIITVLNVIKNHIQNTFDTIKIILEIAWAAILFIVQNATDILFAITTGGMSLIIGWFNNNREKIVGAIGGVWDTVKEKALGAFNGIKTGIRSAMQFVLNKVNRFIGGINEVLSKVPGVSLQLPSLPAFAEGGIVTKPTIGLIGEAGTEAIVPLNKANKFGFGGGGTTININWTGAVDERAAEMVAREVSRILDLEGRTSIGMGMA